MLRNIVNEGIYGKEPLNEVRDISTLREMFESSTRMYAERTAFMQKYDNNSPYKHITYKQFREDVHAFAAFLSGQGLFGKKIALVGENCYEWSMAYMTVVCGAGTIVPLDKELTFNEIKYLSEFAECDAVMCTSAVLKRKPQLEEMGIPVICINGDFQTIMETGRENIKNGNDEFEKVTVNPEDVNIILFTSGTSGTPKGVMLSQKNICSNIMNCCAIFKITKYDRVFSLLPLHHTYECTCGYLCEIYAGSSIAYCRGLRYILKDMQESEPTMFFCVPMVLDGICKTLKRTIAKTGKEKKIKTAMALSKVMLKAGIDMRRKLFKQIIDNFGGKLKLFLVGAAPVNANTLQFFTDIGITAIQGYGMTECSPIISANRPTHYRNNSVGTPVPEVEVKIHNPDKNGIGEVIVRGENVMQGYYKNPEETQKVLKDGWLYTGDMGYIKDSFIYLTGRMKNLIITSNGENIFPEEIETFLYTSPYVAECMVYQQDNVIMAQIYPNREEIEAVLGEYTDAGAEKLLSDEIKRINGENPPYKAVKKFIVRKEEFVKTTTKKIKRFANM